MTGKEVSLNEIRRLPNGEWTQTPAEKLRHTREVKLSNQAKLSGSARFIVVFKPGKVDSAEIQSGDESLKPLSDKLKTAHYPLEFPPEATAILTLLVDVKCQPAAPCTASLINPAPSPLQFSGGN